MSNKKLDPAIFFVCATHFYFILLVALNSLMEDSYKITPYYFFLCFLILFTLVKRPTFSYNRVSIVLLILFLLSLVGFNKFRYLNVSFFYLYLFLLHNILMRCNIIMSKIVFINNVFFWLVVTTNLINIFFFFESGRYSGMIPSPTVFAGYLLLLFILSLKEVSLKFNVFWIKYLITIGLIYFTLTRLVLLYALLIPLIIFLYSIPSLKKNIHNIFLGTILFVYPLFSIAEKYVPFITNLRGYENKASFGLRYYLYKSLEIDFFNSKPAHLLFGKGAEKARETIYGIYNIDILPHNDFMRTLYDFGMLGLIILIIFTKSITQKSLRALILVMLTYVLFYSNMIYNFYLFTLIMIYYNSHNQKKKYDLS